MNQFKPNLLTMALMSSGLTFTGVAVAAEERVDKQAETEVIEVRGYRASLMKAQAIKQDETSIVEALSAEDIGKLPDTSVAESLARLPGLTGERRNGRTSGISVRGFNENYVGTTLNGRELLGMGDNRGVEYDLYPSEIISNIVVYKTPEAGLTTQGIGGTVDLQTTKPLAAEETLAINVNYEQNAEESGNPDFDDNGHRISVNFVEKFADDTIGLAVAIASMESPRQEEYFRAWGYSNINPIADYASLAPGVEMPAGEDVFVLDGHDSFTRSALLERDSIAAVLEFRPNDNLTVQVDALYIDFEENDVRRGIEEAGANNWGGVPYTITGVENGLVTSGYYDGFHSVVRNDARQQKSELTTFGVNAQYTLNDDWAVEVDLSVGEVDKTITDVESYSGVGRAGIDNRPLSPRSWEMTPEGVIYSDHPTGTAPDFTDPNQVYLSNPQAWGASMKAIDRFGNTDTAQDGFVNQPKFDEELDSLRIELNGNVEWGIFSQFDVGVNYSDRSKTKTNGGAYLTANSFENDPDGQELVSDVTDIIGTADLSFMGLGGVVAYDSLGLYNDGFYIESDAADLEVGRLGDSYTIDEEILTLYSKLTIDTEIADIPVRGNVGVQVVSTDQKSTGYSTYTDETQYVNATAVSGEDDYTDVLPTLNLSFEIADDQYIRTSLAKVQSRARMDKMKASSTVAFDSTNGKPAISDPINGPWSAEGGNPTLKPLEANQFDLAYENYFADSGYYAVSFFYKDLTNWHRDNFVIEEFSDYYIDGFHCNTDANGNCLAPATFEGKLNYTEDGLEGFVRGYELQGSLPFDEIHPILSGFGIFASATFLDGEFDDGERVPGLSDESYSLSFFYENAGFEFRVSGTKRSLFATETRGNSLSLQPIEDQGSELWDAQIGYDFSESGIDSLDGLRVTLQAQNITDEDTVQSNPGDNRQITQYQSFGANYMLGVNYTF